MGSSGGAGIRREGESKTSRKTAAQGGRTSAALHLPLFIFSLQDATSKQEVDDDDGERSRNADGCQSKRRRKRGEGPGRRRAGKAETSKFISRAAANTCLGVQAGEPPTTAPLVMSQRAAALFRHQICCI